jgi:hypothetical protein
MRDPLGRRALTPWLFIGDERAAETPVEPVEPASGAFALPPRDTPTWSANGTPGHPFFQLFAAAKPAPGPTIHPWVEHLFPEASALRALEDLLARGTALLGDANGGVGPGVSPATALAVGGLVIGIPVGVLAGVAVWRAIADSLGVRATASLPVELLLVAPVAILAVTLIASVPGRTVSRHHPAVSLHAE